ncbi:MAG: SH3 domain-containing protein [Candidatus Riflebacteria bacterium]|nr:SH3 domain-containing protein [Candidatus Riflebacteria bacterium]
MRNFVIKKMLFISFFPKVCIFVATVGLIFAMASVVSARQPNCSNGKNISTPFVQFDLNIPGVTEEMFEGSFWLNRISDPDRIIMSPKEIERYNRKSFRECEMLKDLQNFKRVFTKSEVVEMIKKVSSRPTSKRYMEGKELPEGYFDALEKNVNLGGIPERIIVRFGITVKRTEMRAFPTIDRIFSEPDDYEFDRFMETALYPVEPLAILHTSSDGKWFFAQAYNYLAWIAASDVAFADRDTLFSDLDSDNFLVVTGKRVFTGFNPQEPEISEMQLDMGVRVPLAVRSEIPMEINGQHPAGNFVVKLPVRSQDGNLEWKLGLISRAEDVHVGYLPLTIRNIVMQAFKFLGQRYGWGGMFNTRDCSAFIMDNFRSMGVMLPRNANEQGKLALGTKYNMPDEMDIEARKKLFDRLPPATPVYMAGHAMLYLGKYENDYYIIHDFSGFSAPDQSGVFKKSKTRGVLVTPLLATFLSADKQFMKGLYSAREFTLETPRTKTK